MKRYGHCLDTPPSTEPDGSHCRDDLIRAVETAAHGESVLSLSVAMRLIGQIRAPVADPLSARELEILPLIAQGTTNRGAAAPITLTIWWIINR